MDPGDAVVVPDSERDTKASQITRALGVGALALPERQERILTTTDLDQMRQEMTRAISSHIAVPKSGVRNIQASKAEASLGELSLIQVNYGVEVSIEAETCGPNFLIQVPLTGHATIRSGRHQVESNTHVASIIQPDVALKFRFSQDLQLLVLRLPAASLERHCAQLLGERGHQLDRPLTFVPGFSLAGDEGAGWLRMLKYLRDEAVEEGASLLRHSPLALTSFNQMLFNSLLTLQPHNYTDYLSGRTQAVAPFYVRRAEDFMRSHAAQPISLVEIAGAAGISVRALTRGFQDFRGTSPMAWLKKLRLRQVHDELLAGDPGNMSITDVALRWGFDHLGHFGQDYRRQFGERPRDTLKRCR